MRILYAGGAENLLHLAGIHEDDEDGGTRDFDKSGLGKRRYTDCRFRKRINALYLGRVESGDGGKDGNHRDRQQSRHTAPKRDRTTRSLLQTPPEIVAGSTRLGAASAQKAVLNMISTLVALRLGHAVRGHMVNMVADNKKLRQRAQRILQDLTGCDPDSAVRALEEAGGRVKIAVLMLREGLDVNAAEKRSHPAQWRPAGPSLISHRMADLPEDAFAAATPRVSWRPEPLK
ncbi:hypothetical protein QW131_08230 [Roseibium salinum]|nr:hypothetical protein [Roseibium salinum]